MAYCPLNIKGIVGSCETSKGGIKEVYIGAYDDEIFSTATVSGATVVTGVSDSKLTAVYKYVSAKDTSTMTSTLNVDQTNGVNYVSTEVVLQFTKMDAVKRAEMTAMAKGAMVAVVVDANGTAYALGVQEPVYASAGSGNIGAGKGDGNNYQITLLDEQSEFPMTLTESALAEVKALLQSE